MNSKLSKVMWFSEGVFTGAFLVLSIYWVVVKFGESSALKSTTEPLRK